MLAPLAPRTDLTKTPSTPAQALPKLAPTAQHWPTQRATPRPIGGDAIETLRRAIHEERLRIVVASAEDLKPVREVSQARPTEPGVVASTPLLEPMRSSRMETALPCAGQVRRRPTLARSTTFLLLLLTPAPALAQEAGGYSVGPSDETSYRTIVQTFKESPEPTQDRLFAGTRFWRLDPGRYEVETWWRVRTPRDASQGAEHLLQAEIEIGLTPHLQIDLYEVLQILPGQPLTHEGNRIELRYSIAREYGAIWANPTIYLEWHPRRDAPDRAEARLLLGGQIFGRLLGAVNFYFEQNVETSSPEGTDTEVGAHWAASYGLMGNSLRIGGELKTGLDKHGGPKFLPAVAAGPNALFKLGNFKLTGTLLYGFASDDPRFESFLIAGFGF